MSRTFRFFLGLGIATLILIVAATSFSSLYQDNFKVEKASYIDIAQDDCSGRDAQGRFYSKKNMGNRCSVKWYTGPSGEFITETSQSPCPACT